MKKTVKPSPVTLIVVSIAAILCIGAVVVTFIEKLTFSGLEMLQTLLILGGFVFFLVSYLSKDRIEFDENTFTVDGETYNFSDITKVDVDSEPVLKSYSTLRIDVYIGEEEVCSLTKNSANAKGFIECMKKHGVAVSIAD